VLTTRKGRRRKGMIVRDMQWSTTKWPWYEPASHKYKRRPLFHVAAKEMMGGCAGECQPYPNRV